ANGGGAPAGHARAVRIAGDRGTSAFVPSRVAGLALAGAALVAAVTVDAEPGSALVRRGAGLAERLLRHASARRVAVVPGDAVGVGGAARLASGGATDVRAASRRDRRRAGAGTVAGGRQRGNADGAARAATLRRGIGAR